MGRNKVKQFSPPGSKTAGIPLKNPEGVRRGEKAGGAEGQPGARDDGEGAEGNNRFEDESGAGVQH